MAPRASTARAPTDRRLFARIRERLDVWSEGQSESLDEVLPDVARLTGSDVGCYYSLHREEDWLAVTRFSLLNMPRRIPSDFQAFLDSTPVRWGHYNPLSPEPEQRNRALTQDELQGRSGGKVPLEHLYVRWGLEGLDQLRVLVCDGPNLLCWFGVWRSGWFRRPEVVRLQKLTPLLRRRLTIDRLLAASALRASAFDAALEALGVPAFLVDARGRAPLMNSVAQELRATDAHFGESELRAVTKGAQPAPGWMSVRVEVPGLGTHYLVTRRAEEPSRQVRVAEAARRWELTPRQTQVLALICEGETNRGIAHRLGCAPGTVELHVTAVLEKSGARSRAQVVALVHAIT